jgi:hypothetical protein
MDGLDPLATSKATEDGVKLIGNANLGGVDSIYLGWAAVCALNTVVPLFFGLMVTEQGGRVGMGLGMVVLFAAVWRVCAKFRKLGVFLITGGIIVGFTQLFPVVQFVADEIGLLIDAVSPCRDFFPVDH